MSRKEMNQIRCIAALTARFAKKFDLGQRKVYYIFYNPVTYSRIQDQSTGLYYQSPGYTYAFLQQELLTGDYRREMF